MGSTSSFINYSVSKIDGLSSFFSYHKYESVSSTNEIIKDFASKSFPEGTIVHALNQSQGKGRSGKNWNSQKGNLFFSILLRPKVPTSVISQLSFVASLAVRQGLVNTTNNINDFIFKWPNDILINNKKISGILLECSPANISNIPDWIVIGIGLNISDYPKELDFATSLNEHGHYIDIYILIKEISNQLEKIYNDWLINGFENIRNIWLKYCHPKGKNISIMIQNEKFEGKFNGITDDGSLIIKLFDNSTKVISGGEVNLI